jgi:hypothetical protein
VPDEPIRVSPGARANVKREPTLAGGQKRRERLSMSRRVERLIFGSERVRLRVVRCDVTVVA